MAMKHIPTAAGLFIALASLPLLGVITRAIAGKSANVSATGVGVEILVEWLLLLGLILIATKWEKLSLAAIGWQSFRWPDLGFGLLLGIGLLAIFAAVLTVLPILGFSTARGLAQSAKVMSLPLAIRIPLVITAGTVEESFYRGYAIERLQTFFGNIWPGAIIAMLAFTAAHATAWGWVQLIPIFTGALGLTLIYVWRRNLTLNIIAHIVTDAVGLILVPALQH